jgi:nucleoside phosphorylase
METNNSNDKKNRLEFLQTLHDALPSPRPEAAELDGLPAIDWASFGVSDWQKPKPVNLKIAPDEWQPDMPLPEADVAVMTWTVAEWAAMDQVFYHYNEKMPFSMVSSHTWRKPWYQYSRDYYNILQYMENVYKTYQGGCPSLNEQAWGHFLMVEVAGQKVLLIKSGMHLAQDGTGLPLRNFVEQIIDEAKPKLLMSIGTAGGVREEDALGSALVTNQAVFYLLEDFKNADFNGEKVQSSWTPPRELIDTAQKIALQVPGFEVLPPSPQYPKGSKIEPDAPDSRIKIITDEPIITTDMFLFGTTKNKLWEKGCIVEMDDAVVGMVCDKHKLPFGFIRNVSDPLINGDLPRNLQSTWASYIYEQSGLYSSFNGALAAWAVIAADGKK